MIYPSEAHATAGRRPGVARSERSERSVRKALLQKIDLKNMSHTMTSQKKKCVPHWYFCIPIQGLHRKKNMSLKKYWSFWSPIHGLHRKKNMSPKIKSEMSPNLWKFSKKISYKHCFWCKIRRLTYLHLWLMTLRPL